MNHETDLIMRRSIEMKPCANSFAKFNSRQIERKLGRERERDGESEKKSNQKGEILFILP